jgi:hypothetical protein
MPCVDGRHRLLEDLRQRNKDKEFKWTRDANSGARATEAEAARLHEPA